LNIMSFDSALHSCFKLAGRIDSRGSEISTKCFQKLLV
jgi:hypothetical protein